MPREEVLIQALHTNVTDAAVLRKIMVHNPVALYGFTPA